MKKNPSAVTLLFFYCSTLAAGPTTYIGLDGKVHTISDEISSKELFEISSQVRQDMYTHGGDMGQDSLSSQGGEKIVSGYLNGQLRELAYLEYLYKEIDYRNDYSDEAIAKLESNARTIANRSNAPTSNLKASQVKATMEWHEKSIAEREASITWYENELKKNLPREEATRYRASMEFIRSQNQNEQRALGAAHRLHFALQSSPDLVRQCHEKLVDQIPQALASYRTPALSAELFEVVKSKLARDPEYAKAFQRELLTNPSLSEPENRRKDRTGELFIGSAQALELFLAARKAHPLSEPEVKKVTISTKAPFDVNTAPLFAELTRTTGIDVGKQNGLKMVGTPNPTTLAGIKTPALSAAVAEAVAPGPRSKPGAHMQYSQANCDGALSQIP